MLEAAGGDPLRAMEIEDRVSAQWWTRYLEDRRAKAEAEHAKESDD